VAALEPLGELVVVAPEREQSGAGHALTLDRPLRVHQVAPGRSRINGTPTDCVHLGTYRLTGGRLPDLVASGINRGLNVGDDVTYSGTVSGALEGALLHVPALAFSAETDGTGQANYGWIQGFARHLAEVVLARGLAPGVLLNVNAPSGVPRGVRLTRQGTRTYRAMAEERLDPSGRPYFWIAGVDMTPSGEADGDHAALREGYASVTPLHANLTHVPSLGGLAGWPWEP
jgi:5'-nucleotidase